jgi:Na+/H+-dicarboxylate symporter
MKRLQWNAPIGTVWMNAVRMTVTPLVVSQLVFTLITVQRPGVAGRISAVSFVVFTSMLVAGGLATMIVMPLVLPTLEFTPAALDAFRAASPETPNAINPATTAGAWLIGLVPPNVLRAAVQDEILGVLLFAFAFGIAVGRMPEERRVLIATLSHTVADAMMTIVRWILWVMPVAVFALALSTAMRGALDVVGTLVVLTCGTLTVLTLLLYPTAVLLGRTSSRRFASAALPVQMMALGTRSSIASLPVLLEAAEQRLRLRPEVAKLVMPLAVSTFKLNRTTTMLVQFLFLAHVCGVTLSTVQIAGFMVTTLVLSYSTLGIPSGGSMMRSAPLFVAAGIPIEAYLLTEAVEVVPDLFKTVVNVTGNLTAATIVNRRVGASEAVVESIPVASARAEI